MEIKRAPWMLKFCKINWYTFKINEEFQSREVPFLKGVSLPLIQKSYKLGSSLISGLISSQTRANLSLAANLLFVLSDSWSIFEGMPACV